MSLEALKSVPCPAGDRCNAFHCLFSHPRDAKPSREMAGSGAEAGPTVASVSKTSSSTLPAKTAGAKRRDGQDDEDINEQVEAPPRKRARLGQTADSPSASPGAGALLPQSGLAGAKKTAAARSPVMVPPRTRVVRPGVSGSRVAHGQPASSFTTRAHTEPTGSDDSLPHASSPKPGHPSSSPSASATTMAQSKVSRGEDARVSASTSSTVRQSTNHSIQHTASTTKVPSKPQKLETLNPRLVNPSPARHDVRYKLLKLLHAEFVRLNNLAKAAPGKDDTQVFTDQELIARALDREEQLAKEKGTLFTSAMKHLVMRYKKMTLKAWLDDLAAEKEAILAEERARAEERNNAARPPILGPPKVIKTNLTPAQEVAVVRARLLTPIDKHAAHGYIPSAPTQQQIVKARSGTKSAGGWEKCERCGQRFQTFPGRRYDGKLVSGGQCKHHWGKAYFPARGPGQMAAKDKVWSCCSTTYGDSSGCSESATHVFKTSDPARLATLLEFAETPENPNVPSDRAVAFDCEMGFTVLGLEMIRLTATAWPTGEALLDVLVRPYGEILDLNSTFSGVWPQDITNAKLWVSPGLPPVPTATLSDPMPATTSADEAAALASTRPVMSMVSTPAHARALLFSLISPSTPLIGHGLENDLNACRIIHPTIVDTVLVFPHRNGLPMRNGLRALAERHLNRSIQSSAAQGHDSAEDARAAGDLVRLRVSEMWPHMDNTGWRFDEDGTLLDPVAAKKKGGVKLKVEEELVEKPAAEKEDKKVKKKSGIPEKLAPLDADW